MPRLRLYDLINSRLPPLIGKCVGDIAQISAYVNSAQLRLMLCREAGEEGWYGSWAEMAFQISRAQPYIICPREVARLENINICDKPVTIQNQFYEYLRFGNGRMSPRRGRHHDLRHAETEAFTRNDVITWAPIVNPPQIIRVYATNAADVQSGARVFVGGIDMANNIVYSQDGQNLVQGIYVTLTSPFVDLPLQLKSITGIQKDPTMGPVQIFQVDPITGAQSLMLTMQPGELVAGYRQYYLHNLPCTCRLNSCLIHQTGIQPLRMTAIAKLQHIPVAVDTDYLVIQNLEAMIEECCSVFKSEIDQAGAKEMAQEKHVQAVRLLNGELAHYLGIDAPAVNVAPFGSARLEKQQIGTMI